MESKMSDEETRLKRSRIRKRDFYAKLLFDQNEYKGAYSMKVIGNKQKYKREKINPRKVNLEDDE